MTIAIGQHVFAALPFNATCGTVESVDSDGWLTLRDAHDMFGAIGRRVRIPAGEARLFGEAPRTLGLKDLSDLATALAV